MNTEDLESNNYIKNSTKYFAISLIDCIIVFLKIIGYERQR